MCFLRNTLILVFEICYIQRSVGHIQ